MSLKQYLKDFSITVSLMFLKIFRIILIIIILLVMLVISPILLLYKVIDDVL